MKRIIYWLPGLAVIALFFAMLTPPETGPTLSKDKKCRVVLMMRLKAEIGIYKHEFGNFPTGDLDQILEKLFRNDPKRIEIFRIDPWGTPFKISFPSTNSFIIYSAGPNKKFGDADDIIFNSVSNDFVKP